MPGVPASVTTPIAPDSSRAKLRQVRLYYA
jgi:hypothetical protein